MEPTPSQSPELLPYDAEPFGTMRKDAEPFRTVPHDAERFGTLPKEAESFRTISEDERAKYTLTVREAARLFEHRGVARSERSITNWCAPNKDGLSRLACHFDPNDRRYWITPESVERVIAEELAKAKVAGTQHLRVEHPQTLPHDAERFGTMQQDAEPERASSPSSATRRVHTEESSDAVRRIAELEKENMDLKITNRAKDMFIEQLREDRREMATERKDLISRVMQWALGSSEKSPLHLEAPEDPATAPPPQEDPSTISNFFNRKTPDQTLPDLPPESVEE